MKTQTLTVNFYRFDGGYGQRIDRDIVCTISYEISQAITTYDPYEYNPRYEMAITAIESEKPLPAGITLPIMGKLTDCGSGVIGMIAVNLADNTVNARCASVQFAERMRAQVSRKAQLKAKWFEALTAR